MIVRKSRCAVFALHVIGLEWETWAGDVKGNWLHVSLGAAVAIYWRRLFSRLTVDASPLFLPVLEVLAPRPWPAPFLSLGAGFFEIPCGGGSGCVVNGRGIRRNRVTLSRSLSASARDQFWFRSLQCNADCVFGDFLRFFL